MNTKPLAAAFLLLTATMSLASWAQVPLEDLVKQSELIVVGEVTSIKSADPQANDASSRAVDVAKIMVKEVLKSSLKNQAIQCRETIDLGMMADDNRRPTPKDVRYEIGAGGVWFLEFREGKFWATHPNDLQSANQKNRITKVILEQSAAASRGVEVKEWFSYCRGNGHGGTLTLVQFQDRGDRDHVVLCATFDGGSMVNRAKPRSKWPDDAFTLRMKRAAIDKKAYDQAKEMCATGISRSQDVVGGLGETSSADFIVGLAVSDTKGLSERVYSGYSNSVMKPYYGPLSEATGELEKFTGGLNWQEQQDAQCVRLITDTLLRLKPEFKDERPAVSWWWVKERLICMNGIPGNDRAVPVLTKLMHETRNGDYSDNKVINESNLSYIVTALDDITGKNFRFDEAGNPRPLDAVVEDYSAEYPGVE